MRHVLFSLFAVLCACFALPDLQHSSGLDILKIDHETDAVFMAPTSLEIEGALWARTDSGTPNYLVPRTSNRLQIDLHDRVALRIGRLHDERMVGEGRDRGLPKPWRTGTDRGSPVGSA